VGVKEEVIMKLNFETKKPNTTGIQFRIDPDTKKKLTALKKFYGVGTGVLIKQMITECHLFLADIDK
tara:strand:+ start:140 stop:340 length:201 start_codon:yes stop_codon:yes gene_type:complete